MQRTLLFIFISIFLCSIFSPQILAEEIQYFSSDISIQKDGTVDVNETILYNFGSIDKHGIYRTIPLTKTNMDGKKFRMVAKNISVTNEKNQPYSYANNGTKEEINLKIGDPDKTITGLHTYEIGYTLAGAVTYFSDHDELYFNSTGNEWNVPIAEATTHVYLPEEITNNLITTKCFTGPTESIQSECISTVDGKTITITTTKPLNDKEGLTVVVSFPKGIVAVNEPVPVVHLMDNPVIATIVTILIGLAWLAWYILLPAYLGYRWWKYGRDPEPTIGQAHVWFAPPKTMQKRDLTPAETGTLIDEVVDPKDIAATIVDLARRRYITIKEEKSGLFQKTSFILVKETPPKGDHLESFETQLIDTIFSVSDQIKTSDTTLYTAAQKCTQELYKSLVTNKFFPENPEKIRNVYMIFVVVGLMTFNPLLFLSALIFGRSMPKKTPFGSDQTAIAKALKTFLVSQEHQFEFQAKNQLLFEKMLPFAIAFGVEKIWAKRFEDITLKQPDWYQGYSFTNTVLLTDHLSRSITSMNNAISPSRSSSGFSSGSGGFSGGGGGGGGGGSW